MLSVQGCTVGNVTTQLWVFKTERNVESGNLPLWLYNATHMKQARQLYETRRRPPRQTCFLGKRGSSINSVMALALTISPGSVCRPKADG